MKNIITFLFCLFSIVLFAQPENPVYEEINGKKFYVHIVQGGNTLYNLSKLYKVEAEKIIEFNPTTANGIQLGQKLIIPVDANEVAEVEKIETKAPATHLVEKGDNLYNISKRYSVSMEEIVKLNPGSETSISLGQELKLPSSAKVISESKLPEIKTQVTFTDSVVFYTVLPHETLYTISKRFMVSVDEIKKLNGLKNEKIRKNDILKIPVKKEKVTKIEVRKVEEIKPDKIDAELSFKSKNQYQIIYLLPFGLDGGSDNLRGIATEFLMGAQIALDSLEKLGLNANVQILDASSDTTKFKQLLIDKNVKKADLIVGPFLGSNVDITAKFAKEYKIRMLSPLNQSPAVLENNPYIYNAVNSDITLIEAGAKYLAENKTSEQIVLIKVDAKDDELYQAFRQKFLKSLPSASKYKLLECSQADLGNFIKKGGNTIFVVPSRDKVFSVRFMNALEKSSSKAGSGKITVFGTKDWLNNDEIKGFYKNKFNLHFATSYDFNYSYEATKKLLRKYRQKYNADLSKYGAQGFDVSLYFLQDFFLKTEGKAGVMNRFTVKSVGSGSGYENKSCFIMKQENYELIQLSIIND
ncbi:MAG: LysM peptidoglycan-binding domain-containing protein [Flavobacteriia bacterium]|jgi:LysM repeat protein